MYCKSKRSRTDERAGLWVCAMTDIKEALAALDHFKLSAASACCIAATETLAKFLESVVQERRDWVDVDKWNMHPLHLATMSFGMGKYEFVLTQHDPYYKPTSMSFDAPTRAEALSKAAAWARADMGGGK